MAHIHQKRSWTLAYPKDPPRLHSLFNCYASTLSEIVPDSLTLNGYADDHSIRRTFKPETTNTKKANKTPPESNTIAIMKKSMQDMKAWVEVVKLKLNEAKTKFIYSWEQVTT